MSFELWHYVVWLGEYEHSRKIYCIYLWDEGWSIFPLTVGNHLPDCMPSCPIKLQNFCMSLTKYLQFTYFSLSCYKKRATDFVSWTTEFIAVFTWNQPLDQVLSHSNPFHIFTVYFFSVLRKSPTDMCDMCTCTYSALHLCRCCSKMEQLFLQAVTAEIQRTGVEETVFEKVYVQLKTLCTFDGK